MKLIKLLLALFSRITTTTTPTKTTYKITREDILMGRDKEYPLNEELEANLVKLLEVVNVILEAYGKPLVVSSGYRPGKYNTRAGGSPKSGHLFCKAVDFADHDKEFKNWLDENQTLLETLGLWQEHPDYTPNWAHIDLLSRPLRNRPGCLKRQFRPY